MPATTGAPGGGPDLPTIPPSPGQRFRWRQVFAGEECQLAELRVWLESLLPDCPSRDDVVSVATELASNAIKHTSSGRGGWFAVEIACHEPPDWVRLAVADGGAADGPRVINEPMAEHGRGLMLVQGLASRTGVSGDHRGRVVWADVEWDAGQAAATSVSHDPYETAIRADQAALEHRYAGVPIWFGRSTLKWWALVGGDELVTASSPKAMADALDAALAARARAAAAGAQDTAGGAGAVYFPRQRVGDDAPAAPASPMESAAVPPMRAMPAAGSLARRAS